MDREGKSTLWKLCEGATSYVTAGGVLVFSLSGHSEKALKRNVCSVPEIGYEQIPLAPDNGHPENETTAPTFDSLSYTLTSNEITPRVIQFKLR